MGVPRKLYDRDRTKRVQSFLADAFYDYVGARVLFGARLPKQAAILSSTAIEKSFKAILAFRGNESWGHLKTAHWNAVRNFDTELFSELDLDFIKLNQKAYELRYTESLPVDFNLIIASREFLAELDHSINSIFRRFKIEINGKVQPTPYYAAVEAHDTRVIEDNHIISGQNKTEFVTQTGQFVYEIRNDPKLGLLEVTYETMPTSEWKAKGFLRPGLVPRESPDDSSR
jgi:hypothetical protein